MQTMLLSLTITTIEMQKLIETVLAGDLNTKWGEELREAVGDPYNCTRIAFYVVLMIEDARHVGEHKPVPVLVHGIIEKSQHDAPKFHAWAEVEDTVFDLTLLPPERFSSKDRFEHVAESTSAQPVQLPDDHRVNLAPPDGGLQLLEAWTRGGRAAGLVCDPARVVDALAGKVAVKRLPLARVLLRFARNAGVC